MAEYDVAAQTRDALGEGPLWVAREACVYWVDLTGARLNRLALTGGVITGWQLPEHIGWLVERRAHDGFLAGFASGIANLDLDPLTIGPIRPLGCAPEYSRLNDAKVDPWGRLWAGTMHVEAAEAIGALYRVDPDGNCTVCDTDYLVTNGPAFSPAGDVLYHTDSLRRAIYRFDLAPDGTLHDRRLFVAFAEDWGLPDGMTVDSEGHVWVGHWDGGRLSRFDPDGGLDRAILLPASRITSCVFGGEKLDRLFVTSAAIERDHEPLAGALFEVDPGVSGIAATAFGG